MSLLEGFQTPISSDDNKLTYRYFSARMIRVTRGTDLSKKQDTTLFSTPEASI
jgi:hypothetical protein